MADMDSDLTELFAELDEGEKLTLAAAAKTPGSLLIVDKDGNSEKLCKALVAQGLATSVDVSEKFPKGRVTGWRLTVDGALAVVPLFAKT